jgi:hypothetical protein
MEIKKDNNMWRLRISWPGEPYDFEDYYDSLGDALHAAEAYAGEELYQEEWVGDDGIINSLGHDLAGRHYMIEYAERGE